MGLRLRALGEQPLPLLAPLRYGLCQPHIHRAKLGRRSGGGAGTSWPWWSMPSPAWGLAWGAPSQGANLGSSQMPLLGHVEGTKWPKSTLN